MDNLSIARRLMEDAFGKGKLEVVDMVVVSDMVDHQFGSHGAAGVKQIIRSLRQAFPDLHYSLLQSFVEADRVCVHYNARGTHRGNLGPWKATDKEINIDVIDIFRIKNGKIVEHWGVPDRLRQMEQLGIWPPKKRD